MKERPINCNQFFISHDESSEITYPCKSSFHFPSLPVSSQFFSILGLWLFPVFAMGSNKVDSTFLKFFTKWVTIVGFVTNQTLGTLLGSSGSISRYFDLLKSLIYKLYFRRGCRGKGASNRNTLAVDHHHPLRAFAPLSFPDAKAPFFAGAKLPSMKASCQSKAHPSSNSPRNARQTSSQTPCSSHSLRRRQQVEELGYLSGRSTHLAPVLRIHKIPSRTPRFSAGGLPPLGFGLGFGNKDSILFHCSSFMNRVLSAIGSPPIAYYTKIQKKPSFLTC